jgi:hypothetical protein
MESVSCVVISTSKKHRQPHCLNTLISIDRNNKGLFCEKIVSIDFVPGNEIHQDLLVYIKSNEWKLINVPLRKSMDAQRDLLYTAKGDWIFYSEDDVLIQRIPDKDEWSWITSQSFYNKKPGMIAYMHGGYNWNMKEEITKDVQDRLNYKILHPDCTLWHRNFSLADDFYWEFPVTMVRRSLFIEANEYAAAHHRGVHSETALTYAWGSLNFNKHFYKATWMKDPEQFKPREELTDDDVNGLFLHKCLHVKAFGNDAALRAIVPTYGIGMSF